MADLPEEVHVITPQDSPAGRGLLDHVVHRVVLDDGCVTTAHEVWLGDHQCTGLDNRDPAEGAAYEAEQRLAPHPPRGPHGREDITNA